MPAILTYQPFKATYVVTAALFELARFPLWLVKYITPYGRQHPAWTFRQALSVRLFYSVVHILSAVQVRTPLPHKPGKEKERFVIIPKAAEEKYTGVLRSNKDVKPVDIGGTWYPAPLTEEGSKENVLVVLHIHGGAFVIGDGRTEASGYFALKMLEHTPATHVLAPQYRLSTLPASSTSDPFPAAIQDSLSAYLYLLNTLRIPAKNIILSGDSAGGNAAIAILRYLSEHGKELNIPNPVAAWLWSPWVQPSGSLDTSWTRTNRNFHTDYLAPAFVSWGAMAYAGVGGEAVLNDPYVSSLKAPFKTDVPMWVNTGSAEVLYGDDVEWSKTYGDVPGNKVDLHIEENVVHDVLLVGGQLGFDEDANKSAKAAGEWLKRQRK